MTTAAKNPFIVGLAFAAIGWLAPVASSATYDESILGDLSSVPAAPTAWTLELGANGLIGSAGGNATSGPRDYDLVSFTIPAGLQLDSIIVNSYENEYEFGMSFFGLQAGSPWLDGLGLDIAGDFLMGWAHLEKFAPITDLLNEMHRLASEPAFAVPLPSGMYTLEIQDVDTVISYSLTFNVSAAVPEPAGMVMMVLGLVAISLAGVRRRSRHVT